NDGLDDFSAGNVLRRRQVLGGVSGVVTAEPVVNPQIIEHGRQVHGRPPVDRGKMSVATRHPTRVAGNVKHKYSTQITMRMVLPIAVPAAKPAASGDGDG